MPAYHKPTIPTSSRRMGRNPIRIIAELLKGPKTIKQLCTVTGLSTETVRAYLMTLKDVKCSHIIGHVNMRSQRGLPANVWSFGPGEDAPYRKETGQLRQKKWRAKKNKLENVWKGLG